MQKSELRKIYLKRRNELSAGMMENSGLAILENFKTLPLKGIRYLHMYYPIIGRHEFNSLLLADWLKDQHPEITLVLSKSDLKSCTMKHIIWNDDTKLAMNSWGITEPEEGEQIRPEEMDMIFVPFLAYDAVGNRLGYGKGYYDRFLSECREDALKTGFSFFPPEESLLPAEKHDIALDLCITPEKIYDFRI